ncbi:glycosyltransferase 87 family protein [Corynebacterium auriscanis]|uniref:glycosyltransferase 87 family protein n=1 Tax=Corynebacterium auriscanis TaxID=99807 RepID=UPI0022460A15|nr:glycosyltransferase 87 family protein [Corynebacterium auriscanis]MCX2164112.1 glycosyltransferase 87 family protein [Corynebacterium auriscanis]
MSLATESLATETVKRIHLRPSHKIVLGVVGALSALVALFNPRASLERGSLVLQYRLDLDVYRVGAQRVLDGLELYSGHFPIIGDIELPFTYPPISALLFTPLTVLPYTASSVLLTFATVAVTWWVMAHTMHSAARVERNSAGWVAVGLTAVLIHLSPIHTSITYGQINVLLMAMVFADAFVVPRRFRGLLTGFAVAIKLTPAVFGLWFLLRKDWGSVVRMGAGTVGATALAWLFLPRDSMRYWTQTLRETGRIGGEEYALNQSLNGLLYRMGLRAKAADGGGVGEQVGEALNTAQGASGSHSAYGAQLWLVLVVLALIVVGFVMVRLLRVGAPIAALCVNALFALLASPISWSHHWSWAPVLLVAIGCYALAIPRGSSGGHIYRQGANWHETSRRKVPPASPGSGLDDRPLAGPRWMWVALLVAGFAAFALEPTLYVPFNDHRELHWNLWQQFVGNAYLWWTLIALALLGTFARTPRPTCPRV